MTTDHERLATFTEIEHGLEGVLRGLLTDPARWILILEVEESLNRYVQFLAYEDGERLVAEAVSNVNLDSVEQWSLDDEPALLGFGWEPPALRKSPNFRTIDEAPVEAGAVAQRALATLRDVFGVKGGDAVRIKLFKSPLWEVSTEVAPPNVTAVGRPRSPTVPPGDRAAPHGDQAQVAPPMEVTAERGRSALESPTAML